MENDDDEARRERKRINILKLETALNGLKPRGLVCSLKQHKNRLAKYLFEFFNNLARLIFHTHFRGARLRVFYAIFMSFARLERV